SRSVAFDGLGDQHPASDEQIIRFQVRCPLPWQGARRWEYTRKSAYEQPHNLVLQQENVGQVAVEPGSPQMKVFHRIDELYIDADTGRRPSNAAFDNVSHAQIFGD